MNLNFNTRTTTTHTVAHVPRNNNKNRKGNMESRRQLSAWFWLPPLPQLCLHVFPVVVLVVALKCSSFAVLKCRIAPFHPHSARYARQLVFYAPSLSICLFARLLSSTYSLSLSESTWTLICGVCRNRHNKINGKVYIVTSLCQIDVVLSFVRLLALCARVCVGLRWAHFYFRLIKNCRCQIGKLLVCAKYFHLMLSCK